MKKLSRSFLYSLTIVSMLLMSTLGTTVVFADDGTSNDPAAEEPATPPPDNTTGDGSSADQTPESQPPTEEPAPTQPDNTIVGEQSTDQAPESQPQTEEPAATQPDNVTADETSTDQAPESQPPPEEPPAEAAEEEPISVPEVLEQTPGETTLVVLNEGGTAEPLATQKAADILAESDPIWCPVGTAPDPGNNGCTPSYVTFGQLITELDNQTHDTYAGNGVIWVESTYQGNDGGPITFDGSVGNLSNLRDITMQGGWDGGIGGSVDPSNPSMADDPMTFTNWTGNLAFYNLEFENALDANASLNVETDGNIVLDNVSVTGNTVPGNTSGHGARLDNCLPAGGNCTVSGDISVNNSSFSTNDIDGLHIYTDGNITINNVSAADNFEDGIDQLTVNGNGNNFNLTDIQVTDNGDDGLEIDDIDGNVTMKNVTATGNGADGVEIDDTFGNVYGSNITVTGNGTGGSADGLDISNTAGDISLYHVTASNNTDNGIEIISSFNGNTKLKFATANNNTADGAYIKTNGNVTVKCSQLDDNTGDGLQIVDSPTAQLLSLKAARNGGLDVNINKNVTYVTKKEVDCSGKSCSKTSKSTETEYPYKTLVCPPTETTASLNDPMGDEVSFDKLCGYDAGVFDKSSQNIPKSIPGGAEYITELYAKLLAYLAEAQAEGDQLAAGKYAMILYELAYLLPDGYSHSAALLTVVLEDGIFLDPLPEGAEITVKFQMPEGLDSDEELSIQWWNGSGWDDLGGSPSEDGLFFQTTTDKIGVFVLAIKETD